MIQEMQESGDVWFASLEEIATHVKSVTDSGQYHARVDELPYYEAPPLPTPLPTTMLPDS